MLTSLRQDKIMLPQVLAKGRRPGLQDFRDLRRRRPCPGPSPFGYVGPVNPQKLHFQPPQLIMAVRDKECRECGKQVSTALWARHRSVHGLGPVHPPRGGASERCPHCDEEQSVSHRARHVERCTALYHDSHRDYVSRVDRARRAMQQELEDRLGELQLPRSVPKRSRYREEFPKYVELLQSGVAPQ